MWVKVVLWVLVTQGSALLNSAATADAEEPASSAPCVAAVEDTTGWVTYRWSGRPDSRRLELRLPPTFHKDKRVFFEHGGNAWTDGRRRVLRYADGTPQCFSWDMVANHWNEDPGCSDTECTLSGIPFHIVTRFESQDTLWSATAYREKGDDDHDQVKATSPDSADLGLLRTIVSTIREDSRTSNRGILFMGGNRISNPVTIAYVGFRLTINGCQLPDVRPNSRRKPDPTAELETRRAVVAELVSYRDSLDSARVDWPRAADLIRIRARATGVDSADTCTEGRQTEVRIKWPSGLDDQRIGMGFAYAMGGSESWKETDNAISERLQHLADLLNKGNLVFLLGGGSEYVVDLEKAKAVLAEIRSSNGRPHDSRSHLLPPDVRGQLWDPLRLDQVSP